MGPVPLFPYMAGHTTGLLRYTFLSTHAQMVDWQLCVLLDVSLVARDVLDSCNMFNFLLALSNVATGQVPKQVTFVGDCFGLHCDFDSSYYWLFRTLQ